MEHPGLPVNHTRMGQPARSSTPTEVLAGLVDRVIFHNDENGFCEKRTKLALAESQFQAVHVAVASKVLVITGGLGVGKTTLVNSILKILLAKTVVIALGAPAGRAAKRLSESTGLEAKTIHRSLETDPRAGAFRRNEDEPLDCDLLVVDETSMVDVPLMRALSRALPERAALLLVGDVDQLALGRARAGAGRHHRVRCTARCALDRNLPPGGREPDHRQCTPDQPGPDARSRTSGCRYPPAALSKTASSNAPITALLRCERAMRAGALSPRRAYPERGAPRDGAARRAGWARVGMAGRPGAVALGEPAERPRAGEAMPGIPAMSAGRCQCRPIRFC